MSDQLDQRIKQLTASKLEVDIDNIIEDTKYKRTQRVVVVVGLFVAFVTVYFRFIKGGAA